MSVILYLLKEKTSRHNTRLKIILAKHALNWKPSDFLIAKHLTCVERSETCLIHVRKMYTCTVININVVCIMYSALEQLVSER